LFWIVKWKQIETKKCKVLLPLFEFVLKTNSNFYNKTDYLQTVYQPSYWSIRYVHCFDWFILFQIFTWFIRQAVDWYRQATPSRIDGLTGDTVVRVWLQIGDIIMNWITCTVNCRSVCHNTWRIVIVLQQCWCKLSELIKW